MNLTNMSSTESTTESVSGAQIHDFEIVLSHWRSPKPLDHRLHIAIGACGIVIWGLGVGGNLSVIVLYKRFRSLRTSSNLFVLNLAIADFLISVGNIPAFVVSSFYGYWVFGILGCKMYAFAGTVGSIVSINTLSAIAVDRCIAIVQVFPSKFRLSMRTFMITIFCIWTHSIAWATAPLLGFGQYVIEGTNTSCTFDFLTRSVTNRAYVMSIMCTNFLLPLLIIVCSYSLIFRAISKHTREFRKASRVCGEVDTPMNKRKKSVAPYETKTARVTLIVIMVFCISWAPYAVIALIGIFGDQTMVTRFSAGIPSILAKFSTVINPLIYALLHPKFRGKLFLVQKCSNQNSNSFHMQHMHANEHSKHTSR